LTSVGLLSCKLALVAAKAVDANSIANPRTRLFETVANFMTAPYFFLEIGSRNGWGGPVHDVREKTLVFCRESPTMQPQGSADKPQGLPRCARGFSYLGRQTESKRIP
jgi:hypothetical protein